jgi:hypothetical protein
MAGDDVLSDELIDDEIKTLDRWARIYPNLRGSANAMIDLVRNLRLAQQRERERLIARAWAPIRHPDECNVDLGECDCGNTESIAAMEARHEAEVRELRAALLAHRAWGIAEGRPLAEFSCAVRMSLCGYAEWLTAKALGETSAPFKGPPLGLDLLRGGEIARHTEAECEEFARAALSTKAGGA